MAARSKLLSVSPHGREGACREPGLRGRLRPPPDPARCDRRRRSRPGVADLRADPPNRADAQHRRRVAPLRLECVLVLSVPQRASPACRTALSGRSGPALLAHPHPRHQTRPEKPPDRASDRARGTGGQDRVHPAPYGPVHCGPGGIYVTALGNAEGQAPGGTFIMDHESFEPLGQWEVERGPQRLAYDGWWHLGYDTMVTSEWGLPETFENGLIPEVLLGGRYGHKLHFWDLHKRKHVQELDFGAEHQLVFELRPAHDPTKAYGFVNCVISLEDLSSSIWTWHRDGDRWAAKKVITIPAEPASADDLPDLLKGFSAVPPLVTDIDLSMDDRFLYVSCWGTGDLRQYDVSDPMNPKLTGTVRIGGIASRASHPGAKNGSLTGGPQMVEVSRDGRRVYFTNSLYGPIDRQFYHRGFEGWMVKLDANPDGGIAFDPDFFIE